jgi:hypothetical protein
MDNASYLFKGKVKGTKTYNLHRERHKKAVEKYGAKNITAIGHSRAGLYLQELQKEFPIKENITYNKASGFYDIGRQNDANQTDVRVGNDVVSLLAPLQKRPTNIVNIVGTKNPLDFNTAHQSSEIDKLGTTFIGKRDPEEEVALRPVVALRPDKPKPNPSAMLEYGKNNLVVGEGIQPRISGVNAIRRMIGVEQRRLKRIADGDITYKSKYMTETKLKEKISRLKKRLASAEKNEGQATEEFFIPKTEKWLKIVKNETYLNTPLKEDGKHKRMVSEIDKRIEELKAKKSKKQKPSVNEEPTPIKIVVEEIKKANDAFETKHEEQPKVKMTKEERKKARKAKKAEYDRLRYLQIKAKKMTSQAKSADVEPSKLNKEVKIFKEEVKEFVEDVEEEEEEEEDEEEEDEEDDDVGDASDADKIAYLKKYVSTLFSENAISKEQIKDMYKIVNYKDLKNDFKNNYKAIRQIAYDLAKEGIDQDEYEEELFEIDNTYQRLQTKESANNAKAEYLKEYKGTHGLTTDIDAKQLDFIKRFANLRKMVFDLTLQKPKKSQTELQYREQQMRKLRQLALGIADGTGSPKDLKEYALTGDEDGMAYVAKSKTYNFGAFDAYNKKGSGFNKKQLTQIILDKNKVIADLEETAYGGGYNAHSYLDTILDSDTTSQNLTIHREHFNSVPKYIQPLTGD